VFNQVGSANHKPLCDFLMFEAIANSVNIVSIFLKKKVQLW
jgi:hypothetical protein